MGWGLFGILILLGVGVSAQVPSNGATPATAELDFPLVFTQLPLGTPAERADRSPSAMLRADYGEGARLVRWDSAGKPTVLTAAMHSACEPCVSFDGSRILFAGKRKAEDPWNIFEIDSRGAHLRQITDGLGDCRSPCYQSTLYTIVSVEPWQQITFVRRDPQTLNEAGGMGVTSLYSCKLDGSAVRRLTYNLSSTFDPSMMPDGRLLLASWQRAGLDLGGRGRIALFGVNTDGADYALFADLAGKRVKQMARVTGPAAGFSKGSQAGESLVVFVESDAAAWDGAGSLGCVTWRRPLHSYRSLTRPEDGLFHSPSPLPDGAVLVSRRAADGSGSHGLYRFHPATGRADVLFDDPQYHEFQAQTLLPRATPDGRSSVVTEEDPHAKLYCLSIGVSDLADEKASSGEGPPPAWPPDGASGLRLRVVEGVPPTGDETLSPLAPRRVLGEVPVAADGSFHLEVPANLPVELQLLDRDGLALRRCGWIWAKNHEPRGCIGCHEDGERTPENTMAEALRKPALSLLTPESDRHSVGFTRDVAPIVARKCAACHDAEGAAPRLDQADRSAVYAALLAQEGSDGDSAGYRYVHPGRARTSPLVWHVLGRNTSRPWDGEWASQPIKEIPAGASPAMEPEEIRTLVEWIDLGAAWTGPAARGEGEPGPSPSGGTDR